MFDSNSFDTQSFSADSFEFGIITAVLIPNVIIETTIESAAMFSLSQPELQQSITPSEAMITDIIQPTNVDQFDNQIIVEEFKNRVN